MNPKQYKVYVCMYVYVRVALCRALQLFINRPLAGHGSLIKPAIFDNDAAAILQCS